MNPRPDDDSQTTSLSTPSITFESLTFSDGTVITLDPTDTVLFVGPNNAGKSAALREIEQHIGPKIEGTVVSQVKLRRTGTINELREFVKAHSKIVGSPQYPQYSGAGFSFQTGLLEHYWTKDLSSIRPLFCQRIATETRIIESNQQPAIPTLETPPTHPIQMLYVDSRLEKRMGGISRRRLVKD